MEYVRQKRAEVAPHDSVERMVKSFNLDVFLGEAKFKDESTIEVNGQELKFKRACIATGGRAFIPDYKGLDQVPYFINENIFNMDKKPDTMLIIGSGPIGSELGQAFQ